MEVPGRLGSGRPRGRGRDSLEEQPGPGRPPGPRGAARRGRDRGRPGRRLKTGPTGGRRADPPGWKQSLSRASGKGRPGPGRVLQTGRAGRPGRACGPRADVGRRGRVPVGRGRAFRGRGGAVERLGPGSGGGATRGGGAARAGTRVRLEAPAGRRAAGRGLRSARDADPVPGGRDPPWAELRLPAGPADTRLRKCVRFQGRAGPGLDSEWPRKPSLRARRRLGRDDARGPSPRAPGRLPGPLPPVLRARAPDQVGAHLGARLHARSRLPGSRAGGGTAEGPSLGGRARWEAAARLWLRLSAALGTVLVPPFRFPQPCPPQAPRAAEERGNRAALQRIPT